MSSGKPAAINPIPDEYRGATPYLCIRDAAKAIDFYQRAFGAVERMRFAAPDGRIGHAELCIGEALFMLADEFPDMDFKSPTSFGGTSVNLHIYVADVDAFVARASAVGGSITRAPSDQFYGDRNAMFTDPFGHRWSFASRIEIVSAEEMQQRAAKLSG